MTFPSASRRRASVAGLVALVALLAVPLPSVAASPLAGAIVAHPAGSSATPEAASTPSGGVVGASPSGIRVDVAPYAAGEVAASPGNPAPAPAPAPPLPPTPNGPTSAAVGAVNGTVIDATFGTPIPNATILIGPAGVACPGGTGCLQASTDANGYYLVRNAPSGADTVVANARLYLANSTSVTVLASASVTAPTIRLEHFGMISGRVQGDDPDREPVSGVRVNWSSRFGPSTSGTAGVTNPYGNFSFEAPPEPIKVVFRAPSGYLSNFTFALVTPYGNHSLGTIRLIRGVLVYAEIDDTVTEQAVADYSIGAMTACSRLSGACFPQGPATTLGPGASTLTTLAPPGLDTVTVIVGGYVVNVTSIEPIPKGGSATIIDLGILYVVPSGVLQLATNISGGNPSAYGLWTLGSVNALVCSLDGIAIGVGQIVNGNPEVKSSKCISTTYPLDHAVRIAGPPLRDSISVTPAWGFPTGFPVFPNTTWVNLTPGELSFAGDVDLTPGTYLTGNVTVGVNGPAPQQYSVVACSADERSVCGPQVGPSTQYGYIGCQQTAGWFCVPAPPGPDTVEVSADQYPPATGWISVPFASANRHETPLSIGPITVGPALSPPGTQGAGSLSGQVVYAAGGGPTIPVGDAAVLVCSVLSSIPDCNDTVTVPVGSSEGTFLTPAPGGWDSVTISGPTFATARLWIDVTPSGSNTTGTISVGADVTITGHVRTASGVPVAGAQASACPIAEVFVCTPLGGVTLADGSFSGRLASGAFPWGSFAIEANYPGFETATIWVTMNGSLVLGLPPLVLTPETSNGTLAGSSLYGTWVDGRVVDPSTGFGVPDAMIVACPITSGGFTQCARFTDGSNSGGGFNGSVGAGFYAINVSAPGYQNFSKIVGATGTGALHLGAVALQPFPWVSGRVVIDPWRYMTEHLGYSSGGAVVHGYGLGPVGAIVQICASGGLCGVASPVAADGGFNLSAPFGYTDVLTVTPTGNGTGTIGGGYVPNSTRLSVTQFVQSLSAPVGLSIFGGVSGFALDGASFNSSQNWWTAPVRYGSLSATANGYTSATGEIGAFGAYVVFVPPGLNPATVTIGGDAYIPQVNVTPLTTVRAGRVIALNPVILPHYGYVSMTIESTAGGALPFAAVTAVRPDPNNLSEFVSQGIGNFTGYLNLTAAAGPSVNVTVTESGFAPVTVNASISESRLHRFGVIRLAPLSAANATIGLVRSTSVSGNGSATIVDGHTALGVPGASVAALGGSYGGAGSATTNSLGQFMAAAPVGSDIVFVNRIGFSLAAVPAVVDPTGSTTISRINLTAVGVIAGTVVANPGSSPVAGATVAACPPGIRLCLNKVVTNASGGFWVAAPPGALSLNVTAPFFTGNATVVVHTCSDCLTPIGSIRLDRFGSISGSIAGTPGPTPLNGATVSACPTSFPVNPPRACPFVGYTFPDGSFSLAIPAGQYGITLADPGYNTTNFSASVLPGEQASLGAIFVAENGSVVGTVLGGPARSPVDGATVVACPAWAPWGCSAPSTTSANGSYALSVGPGPYDLRVTAVGYLPNGTTFRSVSAGSTIVPAVVLDPLGPNGTYAVTGSVLDASTHEGIAGAVVTATAGPSEAIATRAGSDGSFTLLVPPGAYTVSARAPGYGESSRFLTVTAAIGSVVFQLSMSTFSISGNVKDGLTGRPIAHATISEGPTVLAQGDALGHYTLRLPNGTVTLTASAPAASRLPYAPVVARISVNGGSQVYDFALDPPVVDVYIVAVDVLSGLVAQGTTLNVSGVAVDGAPVRLAVPTVIGTVPIPLPVGRYSVSAAAPEYAAASENVSLIAGEAPLLLVLSLTPLPFPGHPVAFLSSYDEWILLAIPVAVALGLLLALPPPRRPRRYRPLGALVPSDPSADTTRYLDDAPRAEGDLPPAEEPSDLAD